MQICAKPAKGVLHLGILSGVIDMHVHTNPDLRLRRGDDLDLCEEAVAAGARAIVLKSHLGSTAERAALCAHVLSQHHAGCGFDMIGSITLNRCVGGINPDAVCNALRLGARVVWLPTQSARNHHLKLGLPLSDTVDVLCGGQVTPALEAVFALIRAHDAVLATGHIAPGEAEVVVSAARRAGVERIVITHPEWWLVGMPLEQQRSLVNRFGVVLERCYAQNMGHNRYQLNLSQNLACIRACGFEHVLIATDGGQTENPPWTQAMTQSIRYLLDAGLPPEQVYHMTAALPAQLLNLA